MKEVQKCEKVGLINGEKKFGSKFLEPMTKRAVGETSTTTTTTTTATTTTAEATTTTATATTTAEAT